MHEKDLADGWGRLPLPDETGKLLGLIFAYRPGGQNLNAAIPINYVAPLAANAKGDGRGLKKMPDIKESSVITSSTSDSLEGVYTGVWSSNLDIFANST